MRLNVERCPADKQKRETAQMQVGILYRHPLTGSIILCTQARIVTNAFVTEAWKPAEGICLFQGEHFGKAWPEYPRWTFMEPKNYVPYTGALKLQNEL